VVTKDRVGILAFSGNSGDKTECLELDFNGNLIERSRLDKVLRIFVAAFTADDHIYLGGNEEFTRWIARRACGSRRRSRRS
jgi:hypothetical protein